MIIQRSFIIYRHNYLGKHTLQASIYRFSILLLILLLCVSVAIRVLTLLNVQQAKYFTSDESAAWNAAHNWEVRFVESGVELTSPLFEQQSLFTTWSWDLQLTAYGYSDSIQTLSTAPDISTNDNTLIYHWGNTLQEWYRNDANGLEQGFTLTAPPPGRTKGQPLHIDMVLTGNLIPMLLDNQAILFTDAHNQPILRYDKLVVTDAAGAHIPAHLELLEDKIGTTIRIVVDDAQATYPLVVDPLITTQVTELQPVNGSIPGAFGLSVDIDGDTAVVGDPRDDEFGQDFGAAYVFTRTVGSNSWHQVTKLTITEATIFNWSLAKMT